MFSDKIISGKCRRNTFFTFVLGPVDKSVKLSRNVLIRKKIHFLHDWAKRYSTLFSSNSPVLTRLRIASSTARPTGISLNNFKVLFKAPGSFKFIEFDA